MSIAAMYFRTLAEAMREKAAMDALLKQQLRQQGEEQLARDLGAMRKQRSEDEE